ncbi:MAG: hypothetical protein RLZZ226_2211 [Pseudomonadota bacterium]
MQTRGRQWGWLLVILLLCAPTLGLMALGGYWLYQQPDFRDALILLPVSAGLALMLARWLRQRPSSDFSVARPSADGGDSPRDEQARAAVEQLADRYASTAGMAGFENLNEWLALGRDTLGVVAAIYRPGSNRPELDIPTPWILLIVERVSHDLRILLQERVPFSELLTLSDGITLMKWKDRLQDALFLANLTRLLFNPAAGLAAATAATAQTGISQGTLPLLKKWLLQSFILQVGHYAILLYSGRLVAETRSSDDPHSDQTRRDLAQIQARQDTLASEPLRILVAGQTNAGKSTLINRLHGQLRAPDDIVPCTQAVTAYPLKGGDFLPDSDFEALLIDTPGFGVNVDWLTKNRDILSQIDLLFLVCSVREAARQADRLFLEALKNHYATRLNRRLPPIIVVATHIDQLRPARDWAPPYNVVEPETPKAESIRAALDAIRQDLQLEAAGADLVPVCLRDGYNLDILWLAVAHRLDDAAKAKVLRMQEALLDNGSPQQVVRQFIQGGRWLLAELQR